MRRGEVAKNAASPLFLSRAKLCYNQGVSPSTQPSPLHEAIAAFLEALKIDRGASDRTVEAYRRDLLQWESSVGESSVGAGATAGDKRTLDAVSAADLERYLSDLHEAGQKASSVSRKLSALRQFFKFCCLERGLRHNPTEKLESPSLPKRLPKFLTQEQVTALLDAADAGLAYSGLEPSLAEALRARDRAMVYLLYATGLRVSELVTLTTHQFDGEQGYVRVRGKGEKERITPFAPAAGEHVLEYLEKHRPRLEPRSDHLFVARPSEREASALSRQSLWKLLKQLALQAGVPTTLSPHVLRHSFATHLLHSGMNLRSLQTLLGHSDLSTTQIYAHVTPEHLKAAHRKFHPRGE